LSPFVGPTPPNGGVGFVWSAGRVGVALGGYKVQTQVTFRDVPVSDAVAAAAEKHAGKLTQHFDRINNCRVVVGLPHRSHHQQGAVYSVRVDVTVPGEEIVINREHRFDHAHEDVYVALHHAFDAMRRRLDDHSRRMRGEVKVHRSTKGEAGVGR
jgi:ribosomal subunit interface protein